MRKGHWIILGAIVIVAILVGGIVYLSLPGLIPAPSKEVKIATISTGTITDVGWNQIWYEEIMRMNQELGLDIDWADSIGTAEAESYLRDYASQGYDLIIANSYDYGTIVMKIAPDYPDTFFAVANYYETAFNVATYEIDVQGPCFLNGMIAGLMTKTNKVGVVGGFEIAQQFHQHNAFAWGAEAVNPDVTTVSMWTQDWNDISKGKEVAIAEIDTGVDVIFQTATPMGFGVFQAAKERNVLASGVYVDQNELAPNLIYTSVTSEWGVVLRYLYDQWAAGTLEGKNYAFAMEDGATDLAPFHGLVPDNVVSLVDKVKQDMASGKLTIPFVGEKHFELPAELLPYIEEVRGQL